MWVGQVGWCDDEDEDEGEYEDELKLSQILATRIGLQAVWEMLTWETWEKSNWKENYVDYVIVHRKLL